MEQVKLYEEARTIQRGSEEVSRFFSDLSGMDTDEPVGDYCRQLESKGERMEAEEQEANKKDDGNTPKDTEIRSGGSREAELQDGLKAVFWNLLWGIRRFQSKK